MTKTTINLKGNKIIADEFDGAVANSDVQAITAISTADATDEATAVALANATKAKFNALLAALKG